MSQSGDQKFTVRDLVSVGVGMVSRGLKEAMAALLRRMSIETSGLVVRNWEIADFRVASWGLERSRGRWWRDGVGVELLLLVALARAVRVGWGWGWRETEIRLWRDLRTCCERERPRPEEVPVISQVGAVPVVDIVAVVLGGLCFGWGRDWYWPRRLSCG